MGKYGERLSKKIWKRRNENMITWEINNGISKTEKRKKNTNKNSLREKRKRMISGKKNVFFHKVDDAFYERVMEKIGLNLFNFQLDFHFSQDKRVFKLIFGFFQVSLSFVSRIK